MIKLHKTNKTAEADVEESIRMEEGIDDIDDIKAEKTPLLVSRKCWEYQNNTISSLVRLKKSTSSKIAT